MVVWNGKSAASLLQKMGLRYHQSGSKTANFSITGGLSREIAINVTRKNGVTAYVNRYSTTGQIFPRGGIDGINIAELYSTGHEGVNGNLGISGSVARHNPSLDPKKNDVLRVYIDGKNSIRQLLAWYGA